MRPVTTPSFRGDRAMQLTLQRIALPRRLTASSVELLTVLALQGREQHRPQLLDRQADVERRAGAGPRPPRARRPHSSLGLAVPDAARAAGRSSTTTASPMRGEDRLEERVDVVELEGPLAELVVHRLELLVRRLELLVHRLELLVGRLELLVGRLELLVGRLQLLVGRLELLDRGLQLLVGLVSSSRLECVELGLEPRRRRSTSLVGDGASPSSSPSATSGTIRTSSVRSCAAPATATAPARSRSAGGPRQTRSMPRAQLDRAVGRSRGPGAARPTSVAVEPEQPRGRGR